jgi:hypothetical protein
LRFVYEAITLFGAGFHPLRLRIGLVTLSWWAAPPVDPTTPLQQRLPLAQVKNKDIIHLDFQGSFNTHQIFQKN